MRGLHVSKSLDFKDKVVIVTGGSRGAGQHIAVRFAEAGANVAITYHSNKSGEAGKEVIKEIEKQGVKGGLIQLNQRDVNSCVNMVEQVTKQFGRVDVLVNNAGIYPHHDTLTLEEDDWDNMMDSNLKGAFYCSQAAAKQMIKQGDGGAIVNILSINAFIPMKNGLAYGASKAGLGMVTRSLAVDLGKYGIRVNAVAPGLLDAPGLDDNVPGWRERYNERAPLGRIGDPEDIGDVCIFFASPLSSWVTGQTLFADGGVTLGEAY